MRRRAGEQEGRDWGRCIIELFCFQLGSAPKPGKLKVAWRKEQVETKALRAVRANMFRHDEKCKVTLQATRPPTRDASLGQPKVIAAYYSTL